MTTKAYYIPYSKKAITLIRKAASKCGATYLIGVDEVTTFTLKSNRVSKLESILAPIV